MKMKPLLLGSAALSLLLGSCAQPIAPPSAATGRPYSVYSTTSDVPGPRSNAYRAWTTAQLQERRKQLYYMIPQTQNRMGVPEYISHGGQLPQQDEIRDIEGELNRRFRGGDKAAELKPAWPESRRHPVPAG